MYDDTSDNWSYRKSNKSLKKNLEAKPGKQSTDSLQKLLYLEHHT